MQFFWYYAVYYVFNYYLGFIYKIKIEKGL